MIKNVPNFTTTFFMTVVHNALVYNVYFKDFFCFYCFVLIYAAFFIINDDNDDDYDDFIILSVTEKFVIIF